MSSARLTVGLFASALAAAGCTSSTTARLHLAPLTTVAHVELERYLGTWYEIARLDHSFERGMSRVTAEYRRRDDGGIDVINRGWLAGNKTWKEARGRAYFVDGPDKGYLKLTKAAYDKLLSGEQRL